GIVPEVKEERARVHQMRGRARRALHGWVDTQRRLLDQWRSRPVLADPLGPIARRTDEIELGRERARRAILGTLSTEQAAIASARARLTALGPAATMARGYTVVQYPDAEGNLQVLRSISQVTEGTPLRVRVVDGAV